MENNLHQEDIDKSFHEQLANGGLGKEQLSRISKSITALQASGHQLIDWLQFGRPPFERFILETHLPLENVDALQQLLAGKNFKELEILKRGIPPMPDFYNVKVTLENL